jgi:hypothetical protein
MGLKLVQITFIRRSNQLEKKEWKICGIWQSGVDDRCGRKKRLKHNKQVKQGCFSYLNNG